MQNVTIRFTYSEQEYLTAARQQLVISGGLRRLDFPIAVIVTLGAATAFLFSPNTISGIVFFLGCLWLVTLYWVSVQLPKRQFRSMSKFREEYQLTFAEEGIHFTTPSINSALNWNIYTSWAESSDFYFLYQSAQVYTVLPKRSFGNLEDETTFRRLLETKLAPGKARG